MYLILWQYTWSHIKVVSISQNWPITHFLPDFRVTNTSNSTITTTVDYVSLLNNWPLLLQSRFLLIRMRVSPDQDPPAGEGAVGARSLKASGKVLESTGSKISTFYGRSKCYRWLNQVLLLTLSMAVHLLVESKLARIVLHHELPEQALDDLFD